MRYEDEQRTPRSLKIILGIFLGSFIVLYAVVVVVMSRGESKPDWIEWSWFLPAPLCLAFTYFIFASAKMRVWVDSEQVRVRMRPFHIADKRIPWTSIKSARVRSKFNAFGEFGGWGIRWNPFNGNTGYIWGGKDGLELTLNDGKRVVVTVNDGDAVRSCLDEIQRVTVS